jgi:hypothetical protein
VRPSAAHVPTHRSGASREASPSWASPRPAEPRDDQRFYHRSCYKFNTLFPASFDDAHCSHCKHFLTARCPHIDEFLDDVEELAPE